MGCEHSLCGSRGDGGCSRVIVFLKCHRMKFKAYGFCLFVYVRLSVESFNIGHTF